MFDVTNLEAGGRYVFAVAAYDKNGDLIGGGVGPTGMACPASQPMPIIMAWSYLAMVYYTFLVLFMYIPLCHIKTFLLSSLCLEV